MLAKPLRLPGLGAVAHGTGLLPDTGVIESGRDGCVKEASSPARAAAKRAPLAPATTYVEEGTLSMPLSLGRIQQRTRY
jgi:hypothetical protein